MGEKKPIIDTFPLKTFRLFFIRLFEVNRIGNDSLSKSITYRPPPFWKSENNFVLYQNKNEKANFFFFTSLGSEIPVGQLHKAI